MVVFEDEVPAKLELLVEGELGLAVLNGYHVLATALFQQLLAMNDDPDNTRIRTAVAVARTEAARLRIPKAVPEEMRASWRQAALAAVEYASDYLPEFLPDDDE